MNKKLIGLMIVIIIAVVTVSGCIGNNSNTISNSEDTKKELSTFKLSNYTLYIPEGYTIEEEKEGYVILVNDDNKHVLVYCYEIINVDPRELVDFQIENDEVVMTNFDTIVTVFEEGTIGVASLDSTIRKGT